MIRATFRIDAYERHVDHSAFRGVIAWVIWIVIGIGCCVHFVSPALVLIGADSSGRV